MQRFRNILVVTNGSLDEDAAFQRAIGLARRNDAVLTLAAFLPEQPRWSYRYDPTLALQTMMIDSYEQRLSDAVEPLREEGMQVGAKVLSGTPFLEIIRLVLRNQHDLVIVGAEDERGLRERLLGGTTLHLMRKCPCPVWVVKPTPQGRFARILAAVDVIPSGEKRNSLNEKIMTLSLSLAEIERSELHILHAWTLYGESALRSGRFNLSWEQVDRMASQMRELHKEWLQELLAQFSLDRVRHQVHLIHGDPKEVIPERAKMLQAELVVMGTVGRTGIPGLLIGNTADEVLRQIECSVLAVKPDGFVTPVTLPSPTTRIVH
jgi:universal stress protein E